MSSPLPSPASPATSERGLVALLGAVQFVNVLDFMMVMPLGPDFAAELGIPTSRIGIIGGSYTAAAAVMGVLGSFFLDRFDRRPALVVALLGLVLGTYAGGLSVDATTLLASRIVAGAFGGPATAIAGAVLADSIPPARRGSAVGKIMGAFSVASVLGVPLGLELARHFGFRAPFFGVGTLGLGVAFAAYHVMPSMRAHLDAPRPSAAGEGSTYDATSLLSLAASACIMAGNFALIPNLSAYLQYNLGYPRDRLGLLYACGGVASFVVMRVTGRIVDRFGSARVIVFGTCAYASVLVGLFLHPVLAAIPLLGFAAFMTANGLRFVPIQSLSTRVPTNDRRARFLSTQSAVQHLASSLASMGASFVLVSTPSGRLVGMDRIAWFSLGVACLVPPLAFAVERRVRAREEREERAADALVFE